MHVWLRLFHGANQPFPASEIVIKIVVSLALGLLVGLEREWANKDIGARTFAMAALLGLLGDLLGPIPLAVAGIAVLILTGFANLRGIQVAHKLEATTSAALVVIFLLGILVGEGHLFTPVACAILVAMLLSLKPQIHSFAGGLRQQEVRSAIVLALLGFVIWPLLPNHFVDPWRLLQPRQAWIIVVVIACLGFLNYVLLRVYGSRGVYLTAILGGLVNSTAAVAELSTTLAAAGDHVQLTVPVVLLTSVAMFARNLLILAIFAHRALRTAVLPLAAMSLAAGYWIYRDRGRAEKVEREVPLELGSPVALKRVLEFALIFLGVQALADLGQRVVGSAGFQIVSVLGGLVSSASTTAASANLLMHGEVTVAQAGIAAVVASMASVLADLPIVQRQVRNRIVVRELTLSTLLQVGAGIAVLLLQAKFF